MKVAFIFTLVAIAGAVDDKSCSDPQVLLQSKITFEDQDNDSESKDALDMDETDGNEDEEALETGATGKDPGNCMANALDLMLVKQVVEVELNEVKKHDGQATSSKKLDAFQTSHLLSS